jgi:hypothetical protein
MSANASSLDEQAATAAQGDEALDARAQLRLARAAPERHHEQRRVGRAHGRLDVRDRSVAGAIVAVREHHEHAAARLPREQLHTADDDVVQRRAAPGREAIHGAQALRRHRLAPRQREQVVVERRQRHLILGAERRQKTAHRVLQLRHVRRHALADVHGDDQLERRAFVREVRDGLRHTVLDDPEGILRQPLHEAVAVVDDGRHLDDVDDDVLAVLETLGPRGCDHAVAVGQVDHDAHEVFLDLGARIPRALRARRVTDGADQPPVRVEQDARRFLGAWRRLDDGFEEDRPRQVGVGSRRHDANGQFRGLCARPRHREDGKCHDHESGSCVHRQISKGRF